MAERANFTRVARPATAVLDLSPNHQGGVEYSIRRRSEAIALDLSANPDNARLQAMPTDELLSYLKVQRNLSRETLRLIHEIAVERLMKERTNSSAECAAELTRAAMASALDCAV